MAAPAATQPTLSSEPSKPWMFTGRGHYVWLHASYVMLTRERIQALIEDLKRIEREMP